MAPAHRGEMALYLGTASAYADMYLSNAVLCREPAGAGAARTGSGPR